MNTLLGAIVIALVVYIIGLVIGRLIFGSQSNS